MALINAAYRMASYIDDFGGEVTNVPLKFGDDVSTSLLTAMGYTLREASISCGGSGGLFDLRALIATFENGATHRFPVLRNEILEKRTVLLENGAVCVNLEGEKWNLVPSSRFADGTAFRTTAFTDIPSRAVRQSVGFDYNSDVLTNAVRLSTSIEINPTALNNCQKSGLANNEVQGGGICSAGSIGIKPRRYIIQALATKTGDADGVIRRVVRNAIVSANSSENILSAITGIAPCAYCVGYVGESINNLELF